MTRPSFAFSGAVTGTARDGQTLTKEVLPGTYSAQEATLAGWDLRTIECDDPTGDSSGDVAPGPPPSASARARR